MVIRRIALLSKSIIVGTEGAADSGQQALRCVDLALAPGSPQDDERASAASAVPLLAGSE